jgi:RNA polymerase sigma factor for flagellar operon FliA
MKGKPMLATATMEIPATETRESLILRHLPLVRHVLASISAHLPPHVDRDDLIEAGTIGLIGATDRFEPERNVRFHTYAITRIRGAILDALRAEDWLPRSARTDVGRIQSAREEIEQESGKVPTNEAIAEHLGIRVKKVNRLTRAAKQASFHSLDDLPSSMLEEEDMVSNGAPRTQDQPELRVILEEDKERLAAAIQELPENERIVISLYYFEQSPLREIAQVLGVTDSRVCQIHRLVLRKLQRALAEKTLVPAA